MSVSATNDAIQDLIAAAQAQRQKNNQSEGSKAETSTNPNEPSAEKLETRFSELLKGRLTANIVFTRLDQQLDMPQRVVSDRSSAPILDRRDQDALRDEVDAFDATHSLEDPVAAPAPVQNAPVQETAARAADNQQQPQTTQNQTNSNGQPQTTDAAAKRTVAADGATQTDVDVEFTEFVTRNARNGNGPLNASVTVEEGQLASQPQTALAAKAGVAAELAKGERANQTISSLNDGLMSGEEAENANSIFSRVAAETAAKGAKQNSLLGGNNQQSGTTPQQQNNGQAAVAANVPANAQPLGLTVASAAQGNSPVQTGVISDAGSGNAAVTMGQNNSVNRSTTPTPAATTGRNIPLPQHALADQVAVNIQKGLTNGQDRITVQLKPHELGRIEIKMDVNHDGKLTAVVSAERPETLDMLRQDSRQLIQALSDAGLNADQNSLSFSLQNGDGNSGDFADAGNGRNDQTDALSGAGDDDLDDPFIFEDTSGIQTDGRLDFRI